MNDNDLPQENTPLTPPADLVVGLRYSLPVMLAEIKLERVSGAFAMERLDQQEIGKIFKPQKRRRVAKPNQ
ncbi:MAG TPA: hypothetical protein PLV33_02045 [Opitutaceae bacterium]|nr:hypothetical protein [Opitutaceae bacterium]MBP8962730.1 hypothetical protein [Opitutaceae bacterium]HOF08758.1 hypothetical protein [Opitutaceae bacterium]HOR25484.1 hypothetical protein [Opitutaceae bacterium]HPK49719.1 hypothetical protein [Opitutaceae bacterium]